MTRSVAVPPHSSPRRPPGLGWGHYLSDSASPATLGGSDQQEGEGGGGGGGRRWGGLWEKMKGRMSSRRGKEPAWEHFPRSPFWGALRPPYRGRSAPLCCRGVPVRGRWMGTQGQVGPCVRVQGSLTPRSGGERLRAATSPPPKGSCAVSAPSPVGRPRACQRNF